MNNKIIIPTKEDVKKLLSFMINSDWVHEKTVGELLGLKLIESNLPKIKDEPAWGYEGLKQFFIDNDISFTSTFEEALKKINSI